MIHNLFSTPIKHLNFKHLDLKSITKYCLSKTEPSLAYSNEGGHHSNFFDLNFDEVLHPLCNDILKASKEFCDELEVESVTRIKNMWCILNKFGHYNRDHTHPHSFLSGVFYPGENYSKDSGDLTFRNPSHMVMSYDWDEKQKNFNQYNSLKMNIQPQTGMCLLFPSFISHYVNVNKNKDIDRLAISFNIE